MLRSVRLFLNRPIAEEFSFRNHFRLAWQGGLYVFVFSSLLSNSFGHLDRLFMTGLVSVGVVGVVLLANVLVPKLVPAFYTEKRWTVGRHILHTLLVLFLISCSNQIILSLLDVSRPSFGQMYFSVTVIGFFPIMLGVFVTEQRRLSRNLAHAQTLNELVGQRSETIVTVPATPTVTVLPQLAPLPLAPLVLTSENKKERLSLQPDQLLYIESVGNYVDVHWLNRDQPQKTVLRSTLKDIADTLHGYPQFFRCHRAFLINLKAVNQTEGNARGYQLTLAAVDTKIPVSRSYLDAFDERMTSSRFVDGPTLA